MRKPALLCFDGSEDAVGAIARAADVLGGGPAVVVHGWKPLMGAAFRFGPDIELTDTLRQAAAEMDEFGQRNAESITRQGVQTAAKAGFDPVDARAVAVPRSLWATLIDVASEEDAGVMVLGAHGQSRVKGAVLGSVSAAVAHHADRPVLIIRH